MSDAFELEICQGKYRYRYEAEKQEVWRNGEPWEVMNGRLVGDKFVFSLAVELDEAIKERDALRTKLEEAEKERDWHAERCEDAMNERDALLAELARLRKEADKFDDGIDWIQRALQAEALIEEAGRQEPVAWMNSRNGFITKDNKNPDYNLPLYLAPGAMEK